MRSPNLGPGVPDSTWPVDAEAGDARTLLRLTTPHATTRVSRPTVQATARRRRIGRRKGFTSQIYRQRRTRARRLVFPGPNREHPTIRLRQVLGLRPIPQLPRLR